MLIVNVVVPQPASKVWSSTRLSQHYIHRCLRHRIRAKAVCVQDQSQCDFTYFFFN